MLWTSDTFVDFEVGLNSAVRKLREALDDSAENPRFVETRPRRGYRFVGSVTAVAPVITESSPAGPLPPPSPDAITTPPRRRTSLWIAVGLVLISIVAAAGVMNRWRVASGGNDTTGRVQSLVVLPFENLTGDAAEAYFVDALTDALTTHLAQVEASM